MKAECSRLKVDGDNLTQKVSVLEDAVKAMSLTIGASKKEAEDLRETLAAETKRRKAADDELIRKVDAIKVEHEGEMLHSKREMEESRNRLQVDLLAREAGLLREISDLKASLSAANTALSSAVLSHSQALASSTKDFESKIFSLKEERDALNVNLTSLMATHGEATAHVATLTSALELKEARLEALGKQSARVQEELAQAASLAFLRAEGKERELKVEMDATQTRFLVLEMQLVDEKGVSGALRQELASLHAHNGSLEVGLKDALGRVEEQANTYAATLAASESSHALAMKTALDSYTQSLTSMEKRLREDLERSQASNSALELELSKARAECTVANELLASSSKKHKSAMDTLVLRHGEEMEALYSKQSRALDNALTLHSTEVASLLSTISSTQTTCNSALESMQASHAEALTASAARASSTLIARELHWQQEYDALRSSYASNRAAGDEATFAANTAAATAEAALNLSKQALAAAQSDFSNRETILTKELGDLRSQLARSSLEVVNLISQVEKGQKALEAASSAHSRELSRVEDEGNTALSTLRVKHQVALEESSAAIRRTEEKMRDAAEVSSLEIASVKEQLSRCARELSEALECARERQGSLEHDLSAEIMKHASTAAALTRMESHAQSLAADLASAEAAASARLGMEKGAWELEISSLRNSLREREERVLALAALHAGERGEWQRDAAEIKDTLEQRCKVLEEDCNSAGDLLALCRGELAGSQNRILSLEASCARLETEVARLNGVIEDLERKLQLAATTLAHTAGPTIGPVPAMVQQQLKKGGVASSGGKQEKKKPWSPPVHTSVQSPTGIKDFLI